MYARTAKALSNPINKIVKKVEDPFVQIGKVEIEHMQASWKHRYVRLAMSYKHLHSFVKYSILIHTHTPTYPHTIYYTTLHL